MKATHRLKSKPDMLIAVICSAGDGYMFVRQRYIEMEWMSWQELERHWESVQVKLGRFKTIDTDDEPTMTAAEYAAALSDYDEKMLTLKTAEGTVLEAHADKVARRFKRRANKLRRKYEREQEIRCQANTPLV